MKWRRWKPVLWVAGVALALNSAQLVAGAVANGIADRRVEAYVSMLPQRIADEVRAAGVRPSRPMAAAELEQFRQVSRQVRVRWPEVAQAEAQLDAWLRRQDGVPAELLAERAIEDEDDVLHEIGRVLIVLRTDPLGDGLRWGGPLTGIVNVGAAIAIVLLLFVRTEGEDAPRERELQDR